MIDEGPRQRYAGMWSSDTTAVPCLAFVIGLVEAYGLIHPFKISSCPSAKPSKRIICLVQRAGPVDHCGLLILLWTFSIPPLVHSPSEMSC